MYKKIALFHFLLLFSPFIISAQVTTPLSSDYKIIEIGTNGGDFTKNLILIHEIFNGGLISMNNAVGTLTAFRGTAGSYNRTNVIEINSSSAYNGTFATLRTYDGNGEWLLKTCIYNGKKYLAVDVPYADSLHDWGYQFTG